MPLVLALLAPLSASGSGPLQAAGSPPELIHFWASRALIYVDETPVDVEVCGTISDQVEAPRSALLLARGTQGLLGASSVRLEGARSICGSIQVPRRTPVGKITLEVELRRPSGPSKIDPCSLGFDCAFEVVDRESAQAAVTRTWPTPNPDVIAALPACGDKALVPGGTRRVERVVDGDTLVLEGGEKVRLLGVDTPETVHPHRPVEAGGKEAAAFTTRAAAGQRVSVSHDPRAGQTDRYGRTLAYVTLPDGRVLNEELLKRGLGRSDPRFPSCMEDELRAAERSAKLSYAGNWSRPTHLIHTSPTVAQRGPPTPRGQAASASGAVWVDSYQRSDGTAVRGHYRGRSSTSGGSAGGDVYVAPYRRSDGTYVRGHTRSRPTR